jgi:hypothetical protein
MANTITYDRTSPFREERDPKCLACQAPERYDDHTCLPLRTVDLDRQTEHAMKSARVYRELEHMFPRWETDQRAMIASSLMHAAEDICDCADCDFHSIQRGPLEHTLSRFLTD